MNTRIVGTSRLTAAACATLITAFSAWAFVNSTASPERDPFQLASVAAAHADARVAQLQGRYTATCPNQAKRSACRGG